MGPHLSGGCAHFLGMLDKIAARPSPRVELKTGYYRASIVGIIGSEFVETKILD